MKFLQRFYLLCLFILISENILAQVIKTSNNHFWLSYTGIHPISKKLSLQAELSIRRNEFVKNPQQLLFRIGLIRDMGNGLSIAGGYCFAETYPYGAFASKVSYPENRFWEQIQLRKKIYRFEVVNRARVEQRFVYQPILVNAVYEPGKAVYSTRVRLMQKWSLPIFGVNIKERTLYLTAFDEIFYGFGAQIVNHPFDQNRAFVGTGYILPKFGRVELGYLHQQIHKSAGTKIENNKTIQINFLANFSLSKH